MKKTNEKKITAYDVVTFLSVITMVALILVAIFDYKTTGRIENPHVLIASNTALFCSIVAMQEERKKKAKKENN